MNLVRDRGRLLPLPGGRRPAGMAWRVRRRRRGRRRASGHRRSVRHPALARRLGGPGRRSATVARGDPARVRGAAALRCARRRQAGLATAARNLGQRGRIPGSRLSPRGPGDLAAGAKTLEVVASAGTDRAIAWAGKELDRNGGAADDRIGGLVSRLIDRWKTHGIGSKQDARIGMRSARLRRPDEAGGVGPIAAATCASSEGWPANRALPGLASTGEGSSAGGFPHRGRLRGGECLGPGALVLLRGA